MSKEIGAEPRDIAENLYHTIKETRVTQVLKSNLAAHSIAGFFR